jgi:menaquinone-dependent protoporphyrinogen oxidase
MSKVLVTYSTNAGSTAGVAEAIAAGIKQGGQSVEVCPMKEITSLDGFETVVIGAPMIFGWHAEARRFLKRNLQQLSGKRVAYFTCALRLTQDNPKPSIAVPISIDPRLINNPQKPGVLSLKERFTTIGHYLAPILRTAPGVQPISVAFFNGKLDLRRLKWWQAIFVLGVVQAKPGDHRDLEFVQEWARQLIQNED